jgi:hypothetical protein
MLYEVRNYHIRPSALEVYRDWVRALAVPYLASRLDLVGFWINTAEPPQITGEPLDALGSANVTWVLRWTDKAQRDEALPRVFSGPAWDAVFAELPGGMDNYLRMEAKFTDAVV